MKMWITIKLPYVLCIALLFLTPSCKEKNGATYPANEAAELTGILQKKKALSAEFRRYWYAGKAEITSYTLQQARYGEMRSGTAVLIFVTEPFLPDTQVKADQQHLDDIPILKLNSTKNYLTGIYPYSIMTSSFYPVHASSHALKISFSAQEWCGQMYIQVNNRSRFEITSHSYFETEADQNFSLEKTTLENEIWNKIRIDPTDLPVGNLQIIPSLEFIRLSHKELKAYDAIAQLTADDKGMSTYRIDYPELERTIAIQFTTTFPYTIENWSETYSSGFGANAQLMTTTAQKNKSIITSYWQQNKNSDLFLRDSLGL